MGSVLVVEDDDKIGRTLETALASNGHQAAWHRTGSNALHAAEHHAFDLVLLDLGLPDIDGIDVCRGLKQRQPRTVVVILTARGDEMDVIVGLESGADDYLVKPFRVTELLARIRAHLRRAEPPGNPTAPAIYTSGDLVVDCQRRHATVLDHELNLRPKEFDLLARLLADAGAALSRAQLMADVWDENWHGPTKTLDVHVAALRQRLTDAANATAPPATVPLITTLRGHGYRLDSTDAC